MPYQTEGSETPMHAATSTIPSYDFWTWFGTVFGANAPDIMLTDPNKAQWYREEYERDRIRRGNEWTSRDQDPGDENPWNWPDNENTIILQPNDPTPDPEPSGFNMNMLMMMLLFGGGGAMAGGSSGGMMGLMMAMMLGGGGGGLFGS